MPTTQYIWTAGRLLLRLCVNVPSWSTGCRNCWIAPLWKTRGLKKKKKVRGRYTVFMDHKVIKVIIMSWEEANPLLYLPETTVFTPFPLPLVLHALQCHTLKVDLHSPHPISRLSCNVSASPTLCPFFLVSPFLLWPCRQECVWTRVCLGARRGESKQVGGLSLAEGIPLWRCQRRGTLPFSLSLSSPPPFASLPLLPCAWPKLLVEHRKGGREIIGCTAANKWARAVCVSSRQEEAKCTLRRVCYFCPFMSI